MSRLYPTPVTAPLSYCVDRTDQRIARVPAEGTIHKSGATL